MDFAGLTSVDPVDVEATETATTPVLPYAGETKQYGNISYLVPDFFKMDQAATQTLWRELPQFRDFYVGIRTAGTTFSNINIPRIGSLLNGFVTSADDHLIYVPRLERIMDGGLMSDFKEDVKKWIQDNYWVWRTGANYSSPKTLSISVIWSNGIYYLYGLDAYPPPWTDGEVLP